jgi:serine/threonine protein kinase
MTGAVTSDRFSSGARIGDYHIEREVAEDATGIVYLATHVVLPRQTHLKVTRSGSRPAAVQLLREACILEALAHPGHPGIPHVHECGVLPDRRPWSAIERMVGVTFEQFAGTGPVALHELVVGLRDVADMLRHAHERGVVHGTLSATTILRTQRRRSVYAIGDWGQARTLDTEAETKVDPRADVYALGAVAFRALTGEYPLPGVSVATHCPAAPDELIAVIDQMLAEPVARPGAPDVYDRAVWLCDTLDVAPLIERPRWTPPQGYVSEGISPSSSDDEHAGFAVRISRTRSS